MRAKWRARKGGKKERDGGDGGGRKEDAVTARSTNQKNEPPVVMVSSSDPTAEWRPTPQGAHSHLIKYIWKSIHLAVSRALVLQVVFKSY